MNAVLLLFLAKSSLASRASNEEVIENSLEEEVSFSATSHVDLEEAVSSGLTPRPLCSCVEAYRGSDNRVDLEGGCFWCRYKSMEALITGMCAECGKSAGDIVYLENWQFAAGTYYDKTWCNKPDDSQVGVTYNKVHYVNAFPCSGDSGSNNWKIIQGSLSAFKGGWISETMYMSWHPYAKKYCNLYSCSPPACNAVYVEHWRVCTGSKECTPSKIYSCKGAYADTLECTATVIGEVIGKNRKTYGKYHALTFMSCNAGEDR